MKCLLEDQGGIATALEREVYSAPALVPASPWLEDHAPTKPKARLDGSKVKFEPGGLEKIAHWVVQMQIGPHWHTFILPGEAKSEKLEGSPDAVAVTAIDRCGVASPAMVLQRSLGAGK